MQLEVPQSIKGVIERLEAAGYEAYLVGGCTRDLLRGTEPKDWDVTTNATPEAILAVFGGEGGDEAFYENDFGTVTVKNELDESGNERDPDDTLRNVEITPYRTEGSYSDARRPDEVRWSESIEEDLKRRDFTINAIAYSPTKGSLIDPFNGQKDIKDKTIQAVGDARERFGEDALRILRAIRLSAELGFAISHETMEAIQEMAQNLAKIANERVRDEFNKILMSPAPMPAVEMAQRLSVFKHMIPELEMGIGVEQNGEHIYPVWEHNLRAMQNGADKGWPLHVRLAALLHDVAKPHTREWNKDKNDYTFYGHEVVGGAVARKILQRLNYPKDFSKRVVKLVRWHMFFSDIDKITLSAVRRLIANVGQDNVWDLMKIRVCDRKGMGRPKEKPYRLRKYESMVEEAMRDPVSVAKLAISGDKIMEITGTKPGPRIGHILHALLDEILEDPAKNKADLLEAKARELSELDDKSLAERGALGKQSRDEAEEAELQEIRSKYGVK